MPKSEKKLKEIKKAPLAKMKDLKIRKDVKGGGCWCHSMGSDPGLRVK